ncbi:A/G-specific adenine glycosylase [Minicystis rosea]|nr:A/G-specific adenine glycosylase [Minicystis rosea]
MPRVSAKKKTGSQLRLFQPEAAAPMDPAARDREIARALGAWFDASARDLPWRRDRRPYAVWLSEIMLQQTRVETVIPYFERFLQRYPDVGALAAAELDDVLHLWSGLGYYRRARQLHAAAREVTERYGGAFPAEAAALRELPGVGAYTAGAVSSIAYGKQEPLVDGNVARVLARVEAIDASIKSPETIKRLWATAARMLPKDRPGRFNEALMELGATVCTPRDPRCETCPLARMCAARASGRERELPIVESKRPVPVVEMVAIVIEDPKTGAILFARRREGGLFGGLWEPPMVEALSVDDARAGLEALGVAIGRARLREAGRVTHVLTHRRMEVLVASGRRTAGSAAQEALGEPYEKASWLDPERPGVGVSTLARKIIETASNAARQRD